jgi:hypothetical protein
VDCDCHRSGLWATGRLGQPAERRRGHGR